jgi:alkanesulfonate monooxygenase SsuD/methylene tetrahydromethanopterin reductase-like flavin-dependent oxidoreductase (luciferase family)
MTDVLFGLDVPASAEPGADPVAYATTAEALGFDFLSASDHPCGTNPSYETWTMLSWIAAATSRIRILTRVLGVPYRPPAMVAKMAETFHRLSGDRLLLGLGGGASDHEFRAFGLRVPSTREKIDGLAEAIEITRGLWTQPAFTYTGRLYHTEAADIAPKPAQPIPIWLGTFGPRGLALTGRLADGWIPTLGYAPAEALPGMRDQVLAGARAAGRDPAEITCALNLEIRVGNGGPAGTAPVSGPVDAVAEQLSGYVRLGFTAINFKPQGPDPDGQIARLAQEVIPAVRAAV